MRKDPDVTPHAPDRLHHRLHAVLFDMDGTLVDTERLWWEAVEQVAGRPLTEADQPEVLGRPVEHTADWLGAATGRPAADLATVLHREFAERVRTGIVPRPGAVELLDALAAAGVPTALVTASPRAVADVVLDALGAHRFATSVTADDTARTKPAPDPYLAACRILGVDPPACVAVEDTETGVASAEAAGCTVLAVPSLAPIGEAPGRTVREQPGRGHGRRPGTDGRSPAPRDELEPVARRQQGRRPPGQAGPGGPGERCRRRRAPGDRRDGRPGAGRGPRLAPPPGRREPRRPQPSPVTARFGDPDVGFYGAAGVRIAVAPGREVDVWTAHLHYTPYGPYEAAFDGLPAAGLIAHEELRLSQMRDALDRIAESSDDGVPVVLVGDFNCPPTWTGRTCAGR